VKKESVAGRDGGRGEEIREKVNEGWENQGATER
jgi:hypothetical protein